ncbi:alanine racemase [Streptomyces syringium]|uniref:alanine racemase n=1 Tax=Streptomyces syringium TaxID=76729 RepID=UPI003656F33B
MTASEFTFSGPRLRSGIRARIEARIDLDALRGNVRLLAQRANGAELMVVVKSNAYGHGLVRCARAALEAGAGWLGTAVPEEALALRRAGVGGRVLAWLWTPGGPFEEAVRARIDVSVSGFWDLAELCRAAARADLRARVHLKVDSGLGRNGCPPQEWPGLVAAALEAQSEGLIDIVGLWSHLAVADEVGHPSVAAQAAVFRDAVHHAEQAGVRPEVRHLANSSALFLVPGLPSDLIRVGIPAYGLSPSAEAGSARELGLRPVMTLAAFFSSVKRVPAGQGVGYGLEYRTQRETTLGLVPAGYFEGIPRRAAGTGAVLAAGKRRVIASRVGMDQFVVDLSGDDASAGDEVLVFGPGDDGEPTAEELARAAGMIPYEVVAGIGAGVPRVYQEAG